MGVWKALFLVGMSTVLGWAGAPSGLVIIPYLSTPPVIDGALDANLTGLPVTRLTTPEGNAAGVSARLAYGADFLYLAIDSPQDAIQCRDRAYQNGDGLQLVLALAAKGGDPTGRFQVLGFSPQPDGQRTWQYAFTWYRDKALEMRPLSGVQFAWQVRSGRACLELRLPWSAVAPYHPWLRGNEALGLNLAYVRAQGTAEKVKFSLLEDRRMEWEDSLRRYLPVQFEPPGAGSLMAWAAEPLRSNLSAHQSLGLRVAVSGANGHELPLAVRILSGEGEVLARKRVTVGMATTLVPTEVDLGILVPPGGYVLEVEAGGGTRVCGGISVLPAMKPLVVRGMLEQHPKLPDGSRATLLFRLGEVEAALAGLGPLETAGKLRMAMGRLLEDIEAVTSGVDPVAACIGIQRRAYRSALDGTLQPYTVRVPDGLRPGTKVPLLIYLHGSGNDDRGMLDRSRAPESWLQMAPRGRGISNCFSSEHAQEDLREALADMLAHYPVDPDRVFLAGFSMGGYGVYRTALQSPGRFRGLVVLAGQPDLGPRWLGPGHPDALDPLNIATLKGESLFIVHGTEDRNCPFEKTAQMVEALKSVGARVIFQAESGRGHDGPSPEVEAQLMSWLQTQAR